MRELQDDLIESVIRDVAELDYSSLPDMPEVMLVTANELRGILQANGVAAVATKGKADSPIAAPVVPLTDSELAKIAVEDEFLLYCDQDSFNEIARAIELAHGITGGKP